MEQWLINHGYQHPLDVKNQILEIQKELPKLELRVSDDEIGLVGLIDMESAPPEAKTIFLRRSIPPEYPAISPLLSIEHLDGFCIIPNQNIDTCGSIKVGLETRNQLKIGLNLVRLLKVILFKSSMIDINTFILGAKKEAFNPNANLQKTHHAISKFEETHKFSK